MQLFDAIARRESCRAFVADKPVEREKIAQILEAARAAPSASNGQPWRFVAVTNKALLAQLAPLTLGPGINKFVSQAPCLIAVWQAPANISARFGASIKQQDFPSVDIGLAVGQLSLAATALGLGSCILGWFDEPQAKALLGIPMDQRLRLMIALGYPQDKPQRNRVRKPLEEIARFIEEDGA